MLRFRPLVAHDRDALWEWLRVALWDPPQAGPRRVDVLQHPGVRIHAAAWGQPPELGIVAVVNGRDASACWARLLPESTDAPRLRCTSIPTTSSTRPKAA